MEKIRELFYYKDYFKDFVNEQNKEVKDKIYRVLFIITHLDRVPAKFLKHIDGIRGLYEIRVESGNNIFRIFCCFDEGRIVVLFNGFQKKSQKTPLKEIEIALKLMNEYFNQKRNEHG